MKTTIESDIEFVKEFLPNHYEVSESKKSGSIHCKSAIGIIGSNGDEDEEHWGYIFSAIKNHFGDRFQEVFHNTCTNHVDFTIYLKQ